MRADFEELVRRSLQAQAADVTPDPATWEKVSARIRRQRKFRLALAGFAAAAGVAFAAVVLPQVLTTGTVEFDDQIATAPTTERLGPSETGDGQQAVRIEGGVVATDGTDIDVYDEAGAKVLDLPFAPDQLADQPMPITDVAVRPGSTLDELVVVYRRAVGCDAELGYVVAASGTVDGGLLGGGDGCWKPPVWSPDGRYVAWVEGEPGDYVLRVVEVASEPDDLGTLFHDIAAVPLETGALSGLEVVDWVGKDIGIELRFLGILDDGRVARATQQVERHAPGGAGLVPARELAVIDQALDTTVLAWQDSHVSRTDAGVRPEYLVVADFADDVATDPRLLATDGDETLAGLVLPAGVIHPDGDDGGDVWMAAFGQRVVLGDGHGRVWTYTFDGQSWAELHEDDGVVHASLLRPALAPAPGPTTPPEVIGEDEGPGTDIEVGPTAEAAWTRDAIIAAAEARDWDTLRGLMSEDFTSNFGGEEDHVAYWQRLEEQGEDPLGLLVATLQTRAGRDESGNIVWPWVQAGADLRSLSSAELEALAPLATAEEIEQMAEFGGWLGPRAGIHPNGAWRYFILGGD